MLWQVHVFVHIFKVDDYAKKLNYHVKMLKWQILQMKLFLTLFRMGLFECNRGLGEEGIKKALPS